MKKARFLAIFFLFCCSYTFITLEAALFDHLTPPQGKDSGHSIPGIDYIYMINLDIRPEKFQKSLQQLKPYNITPYRFSAVYGKLLSSEVFEDIMLKYQPWMKKMEAVEYNKKTASFVKVKKMEKTGAPYACIHMTPGYAGSFLSHLSLLKDGLDSGYETIWILEDDIQVVKDPNSLSSLIKELDILVPDWDVLFTDSGMQKTLNQNTLKYHRRPDMPYISPNSFNYRRRQINKTFSWEGPRYGTQSYIVRKSGMKKILDYFQENGLFLVYDVEFMYLPINAIRLNSPVVTDMLETVSDSAPTKKLHAKK